LRDATAKWLSTLHTGAYRLTGGRVGRRLVSNDMLLLTTEGRSSGRQHTIPLLYLRDGTDIIVIASWGGRDYPPDWYLNLTADPGVVVQIDGTTWSGSAGVMPEPERSVWWERAVAAYDGYEEYQSRTDRVIPIVRISRKP
jgi:deazaflavin-dependent oxidoreductase (nitroreductase family)